MLDLGQPQFLAQLFPRLSQPLPLLADDLVLVEHLLDGRRSDGQRADAVTLVVQQVLQLFDLTVFLGNNLVGAGDDLFDLQPPIGRLRVAAFVGPQLRQHPLFLRFPRAAIANQGPHRSRRQRRQLPLQLDVAGLQVADFLRIERAGRAVGIPRPRGLKLGLELFDLTGEAGGNLPPAIAARLEKLANAGVLQL